MSDKLTPFFWFENDLKGVLSYYQNIFNQNGQEHFETIDYVVVSETPEQKLELATIKLFGNEFQFMAAGPYAKFTDAISLMIKTDTQEETDYYWQALTKEGKESQCGWCQDKYGVSWQITPRKLLALNMSADAEVRNYSMAQMMKMKNIIIKDLEK
jgi:predicted 3-demethylubiquinone-9 3-methyltransferase (glyoxalase superfamily)